jgi:MOSC domain-containing protein YiiM
MASIYSIVYQPKDQKYIERQAAFIRIPVQQAQLIAGYGIEGDQKGGHDPLRQLNILSHEWLLTQQPKGYKTQPGQFGEQIILAGLAVESLEPGARLQLGNEAQIEIAKRRMPCERLQAAQGKSIEDLGPVGMLAKVIVGGQIRVGDEVTVLEIAAVIKSG